MQLHKIQTVSKSACFNVNEPPSEKVNNSGFRPGLTQTWLLERGLNMKFQMKEEFELSLKQKQWPASFFAYIYADFLAHLSRRLTR